RSGVARVDGGVAQSHPAVEHWFGGCGAGLVGTILENWGGVGRKLGVKLLHGGAWRTSSKAGVAGPRRRLSVRIRVVFEGWRRWSSTKTLRPDPGRLTKTLRPDPGHLCGSGSRARLTRSPHRRTTHDTAPALAIRRRDAASR